MTPLTAASGEAATYVKTNASKTMSSNKDKIIAEIDAIIDTYGGGTLSMPQLIEMRRNLAVLQYSLTNYVKQVYGNAGLKYIARKYRIAEHIVDARNLDAKAPMNFLEQSAAKLPSVVQAQNEEVMAEAEKEELVTRIKVINNVLASMQQELADMRVEKANPSYQEQR